MKKIVSFSAIVLLLVACDKGKFETKPQLTLKSINNTEIRFGAPLQIVLEFTDKEGDVSDTLAFYTARLNASDPFTAPPSIQRAGFAECNKRRIEMKLEYQTDVIFNIFPIRIPGSNPERNEKDTMRYKIVVHDKGGNTSDTVTIDNIIVDRDQ
jgi:hypothetical protein